MRELGLDVVGIIFHVRSGCFNPNAFGDVVMHVWAAFEMGAVAGYVFSLLDVGKDANFKWMATMLWEAIEAYFLNRVRDGVGVIAEPGCFLVSGALMLMNIIAWQTADDGDAEGASVMCKLSLLCFADIILMRIQTISMTGCMGHSTASCLTTKRYANTCPRLPACVPPALLPPLSMLPCATSHHHVHPTPHKPGAPYQRSP